MISPHRPATPPDPRLLDDHRTLIRSLQRRGLIRGGLSLGALGLLTGCDVSTSGGIEQGLLKISAFNDWVQYRLFDPSRLAPTYPKSQVLKPAKFNAYYDITKVRPVDVTGWKLEVSGLVADRTPWTLQDLAALPQSDMIIRHVCIEGWDYIGEWSGPTLRSFLERVGADTRAKYVAFRTADDYPSSIDMGTALHPQTLLATGYADAPITDPFGFPVRLRMATKLGFKNPKWITAIEVTNTYSPGYWEKQGFNWFSGM